MIPPRREFWALVAIAIPFALAGCGEVHHEHATVHGKVMYKGKPLTTGSVLFVPVEAKPDGQLLPAQGELKSDGTYELLSAGEPGAVIGVHKVVIMAVDGNQTDTAFDEIKGPAPASATTKNSPRFKALVPEKYSKPDTTPLTRTVKPGDNVIDIDLEDDN